MLGAFLETCVMGEGVLFRGVDKILEGFVGEEGGEVGMLHGRDVWVWFESEMVRQLVIQGWGTRGLFSRVFIQQEVYLLERQYAASSSSECRSCSSTQLFSEAG